MDNKLDREIFVQAMKRATPGAFEIDELMQNFHFRGGAVLLAAITSIDGYIAAKIFADGFNLGFAYAQAIQDREAARIPYA